MGFALDLGSITSELKFGEHYPAVTSVCFKPFFFIFYIALVVVIGVFDHGKSHSFGKSELRFNLDSTPGVSVCSLLFLQHPNILLKSITNHLKTHKVTIREQ